VIIVLGVTEYPKLEWARVITWSDSEIFKIQLRDALQEIETIDRDAMMSLIADHIKRGFVRKSMVDFEYLKNEIDPPVIALILGALAILVTGAITIHFVYNRRGFTARTTRFRRSRF
jgi:hypothetical protein